MGIRFEEAKSQFLSRRYRESYEEEEEFFRIYDQLDNDKIEFLKWEFADNQEGFIDTRIKAGLLLFHDDHQDEYLWSTVKKLILSEDPDDRDTASEVIQEIGGERSFEYMRLLLNDPFPYLQLDACDYLKTVYPKMVKNTLIGLTKHQAGHVRKAANERLLNLEQ